MNTYFNYSNSYYELFSCGYISYNADECYGNADICGAAGVAGNCVNSDGSYSCTCLAGYALNTDTNYCDGK